MRASRWIVGVAAAAGFAALPGVASAATHRCAPVTIGSDHFTNITAHGVTCKYARTVLIPVVDKNGEPPGWAEGPPVHISQTEVRDTYVRASKKVVFDFTF